jgi:hypothetical protein
MWLLFVYCLLMFDAYVYVQCTHVMAKKIINTNAAERYILTFVKPNTP